MTTATVPHAPAHAGPPAFAVDVLICGAEDRGDDGAPLAAASHLADQLPAGTRIRAVGQLDVEDLLSLPAVASVVVVDAATGIAAGTVVTLRLDELRPKAAIRPRSTHAVDAHQVIALASLLRERPLDGRIVAIGGSRFGLGDELSPAVAEAIPAFVKAVLDAVESLRS